MFNCQELKRKIVFVNFKLYIRDFTKNIPQVSSIIYPSAVSAKGIPLYPTWGINIPQCLIQGFLDVIASPSTYPGR